jgi:hypothetical protein
MPERNSPPAAQQTHPGAKMSQGLRNTAGWPPAPAQREIGASGARETGREEQ